MSRTFPFMPFPRAAGARLRVDEKKCASHSGFVNRIPIRKTPALGWVRGLVVSAKLNGRRHIHRKSAHLLDGSRRAITGHPCSYQRLSLLLPKPRLLEPTQWACHMHDWRIASYRLGRLDYSFPSLLLLRKVHKTGQDVIDRPVIYTRLVLLLWQRVLDVLLCHWVIVNWVSNIPRIPYIVNYLIYMGLLYVSCKGVEPDTAKNNN